MINDLVLKLYRALVVLPPAASLRMLRKKASLRASGRLDPGNSAVMASVAHSIDREYGIDTSGVGRFDQLRSGKFSDVFSTGYCGSQPSIIRRALEILPDHHSLTFFDLGCGKGRALAVASEFPFRRIVGVELAPSLASAARINAGTMRSRFPGRTPIEIIERDALAMPIPDGPLVIYLYHPFYRKIMTGVIRNIEKWLLSGHSKVYIIYYNPMYFDLFDKSRLFRRVFAGMMDSAPGEQRSGPTSDALAIWQSIGEPILQSHPKAAARIQIAVPGWQAKVVW